MDSIYNTSVLYNNLYCALHIGSTTNTSFIFIDIDDIHHNWIIWHVYLYDTVGKICEDVFVNSVGLEKLKVEINNNNKADSWSYK